VIPEKGRKMVVVVVVVAHSFPSIIIAETFSANCCVFSSGSKGTWLKCPLVMIYDEFL